MTNSEALLEKLAEIASSLEWEVMPDSSMRDYFTAPLPENGMLRVYENFVLAFNMTWRSREYALVRVIHGIARERVCARLLGSVEAHGSDRDIINRALSLVPAWAPEHGGDIEQAVRKLAGMAAAFKERIYEDSEPTPTDGSMQTARPLEDWNEDDGAVLWWKFPGEEPPYVGSPHDDDWPEYHTHWTRLPCVPEPEPKPECCIIGGMRGWEGKAAFVRVPLLVRRNGELYIARGNRTEPITEEEYRGVLESGEALELPQPQPYFPGAKLWLLRKDFPSFDELLTCLDDADALRCIATKEGSGSILLVNEWRIKGLLEILANMHRDRALSLMTKDKLNEALEAAELAVDLEKRPTPEKIALVVELYKRLGDIERADAYLKMVLISYGQRFHDDVVRDKNRLSGDIRSPH